MIWISKHSTLESALGFERDIKCFVVEEGGFFIRLCGDKYWKRIGVTGIYKGIKKEGNDYEDFEKVENVNE